jgi:hypothetical protein
VHVEGRLTHWPGLLQSALFALSGRCCGRYKQPSVPDSLSEDQLLLLLLRRVPTGQRQHGWCCC